MDDAVVRRVVRAKIENGHLPHKHSGAVSASNGTEERCDACATPISSQEVLIRLSQGGSGRFVFHATCFVIWRDERAGNVPPRVEQRTMPQPQRGIVVGPLKVSNPDRIVLADSVLFLRPGMTCNYAFGTYLEVAYTEVDGQRHVDRITKSSW
jgi:hypothetical protein